MRIGILQLSDIHIKVSSNSIISKYKAIIPAIKEYLFELECLFIAITGDSAFSGKQEEYIIAMEIYEDIKAQINSIKEIDVHFIIIPGNHDCDFGLSTRVRDGQITLIQQGNAEIDKDVIEELIKPQKEFFNFLSCFDPVSNKIYSNYLFTKYAFNLQGYSVAFNCLNSSWISELHEKPGSLIFPIDMYKDVIKNNSEDLNITVIHHPRNWFQPENARIITSHLEKNSDIVLTGHEHVATGKKVESFEGSITQYVEGGVLQESFNDEISEFNIILFNLAEKYQKFSRYSWNGEYYSNNFETEWKKFDKSSSHNASTFTLSDNFAESLNDPGINIKHPRKTKVSLEDIYVFPDAKKILNNDKPNKIEQIINLSKLKDYKNDFKVIIYGAEKSGKSALTKIIYHHYYQSGFIPVYLDAQSITGSSISDVNKVIYKNFTLQYSKDALERYKQVEEKRKLLIIDGLEKYRFNSKNLIDLIDGLTSVYPNIIITGNEMLKLSNLILDEEPDKNSIEQFEKFEILQFGHVKRAEFVEKWNTIGQMSMSDQDIIEKQDRMLADINTVIGNNFVPSFPFFLLILLQTAESGFPHSNKESAYGYYYELLITQSFININMQNKEIDAYYTYIAELAFYFYENEIVEFSKLEFSDFNTLLNRKYDLSHDFEKTVSKLTSSGIIENSNNSFRFKYSYIYYYFVARYLSMKITDEKIRSITIKMCTNLQVEEYANILMFLTHLSKDPFILNSLYDQAKKIFNEFEPTKLDKDISLLNELAVEIPKIVYNNIEVKKHREEKLMAKDEIERSKREMATTTDGERRDETVMDVVAKLNVAFKTIEIMGQILRNYYGSIEASEKLYLAEETYMIGLRTLNSFLSLVNNNVHSISAKIERIIQEEEKNPNKTEVEKLSRRVLFNLCCTIAFQTIIKISESIGSKELYLTYKQISEKHNMTSVKLIEISIKLDQLRALPYNDIKRIKESIEGNIIATSLLKLLVINHLYMYDTNISDKQRICSLLSIPISKQINIDITSTQKKNR
ncbi:STAND family AAA ATPase [Paenibacillus sp. TSA_86.1]|uniref:STAND family AAA ATPase n=1 Tax=Paenibacillus sp. TSA_86.1 TaxID=3415649 RepID=UPI004046150A